MRFVIRLLLFLIQGYQFLVLNSLIACRESQRKGQAPLTVDWGATVH